MKVCLIGEFSGNLDEGMRIAASYLAGELSKNHGVLPLDARDVLSKDFWKRLRTFEPQVIHYIPGPSLRSFVLTKILSLCYSKARTVMSAMHPDLPAFSKAFIPLLKPDLILILSREDEKTFKRLGCKTGFLLSGVDTGKFVPVTKEAKDTLRRKYGLGIEVFLILHVGSIKERRKLQILGEMQGNGNQVVIIGSTSTRVEQKIKNELEERHCLVWTEYFKHIEEIYALADCYIFPTTDKAASIALPLSVLEAMACNLPVISARFGALPEVFGEGDGLIFADKEDDFFEGLKKVKNSLEVKTREKVLPYSWEKVVSKLEEIYSSLVLGRTRIY